MTKKILILCLDYDDCLIRKYDNHGQLRREEFDSVDFDKVVNDHQSSQDKAQWKDRLLKENDPLFNFIVLIAVSYDEIIVCCGSNRQNEYADATNACRDNLYSGSCYEALEILVDHFQSLVGIPVQLDRTTTADYFLGRQQGETFSSTLEWAKGQKSKTLFEDCPNDRTKISLHYRLMHYFADKFERFFAAQTEPEEVKIDYFAVDDSYQGEIKLPNPAIIDAVNEVYKKKHSLIPKNTLMVTLPYQNGELKIDCMRKIEGTGEIDRNFNLNMEKMMVSSMDGDSKAQQYRNLFDFKSCSCWEVFTNHEKEKCFSQSYQNFVEEFIERHKTSYSGGWFCSIFNRTNLPAYNTLDTKTIFEHAKYRTFFGFKNRTCRILEEMVDTLKP